MEKSNMKALACEAKRRLAMNNRIGSSVIDGGEVKVKIAYQRNLISTKEDDELFEKVKEILTKNFDTPSPLGQIADQTKFKSMNDIERDSYIVKLSAKYQELKARFERENLGCV